MKTRTAILVPILLLICGLSDARAYPPAGGFTRIEVSPTNPVLDGRESRQRLLVTGYRRDGSTSDLTDSTTFVSTNPRLVKMDSGIALPVSDGTARITVRAGGLATLVNTIVRNMRRPFKWTFENHVESVFSKQGCNTGPCHGAGSGKGGLRLSLRAYDPDADYVRLRIEGRGRRVVRTNPADSLLLKKPSLAVAHVGGLKLRRDSLEYRVVSEWIARGALAPHPKTTRITGLTVFPPDRALRQGAHQRLLVTAHFSDGHTEDVTHWARYNSNEEPIAKVDDSGQVTMRGRGETAVTAWYLGKVAFARVRVPFNDTLEPRGTRGARGKASLQIPMPASAPSLDFHPLLAVPAVVNHSSIDALVESKLAQLGLTPTGLCTDGEFIRRAFLDCIGTLPAPEETRAFLADRSPGKRVSLIDSLLDRPEYVDFWTYRWGDLLRVNRDLLGSKGMAALQGWVRDSVARNVGWDRFVYDIITASGPADSNGPANFYRMGVKPEEFAETVSQAFLGIRVQCAHCHNHPFEHWTQADYYRMASVFARVGRKTIDERDIVYSAPTGDVTHPRFGRPLPPAAFDGPSVALNAPGDRRLFLARWATSPDNPFFARSIVNRVWKQFMGRGLVEPVDDIRLTNPASNEPLMQALTRDLASNGFDLKRLMRRIMLSRAYQRSAAPNGTNVADDRFYSRYLTRRVGAETLLDAVCQVTGVPEKFSGMPPGARAVSLPDTRIDSAFLDAFGRPARQVTCECERNMEPNMAQALHLINASTLNNKITAKSGVLEHLLSGAASDDAIADELFLRCISRHPCAAERAAIHNALSAPRPPILGESNKEGRRQVFADLFWALLSSPEFVFNH